MSRRAPSHRCARAVLALAVGATPGVAADIAVSVAGILSDVAKGQLTYVSTIRTTPAVWVKGAAAPAVKVDGAGFTKEAKVEICGAPAQLAAGTPPTAKTLVVTPPSWADLTEEVDPDKGGVCTVRVTVGDVVSAITAGSTFTYAAHEPQDAARPGSPTEPGHSAFGPTPRRGLPR